MPKLLPAEQEYALKYGGLPKTKEDLLLYAAQHYPPNDKTYQKLLDQIDKLEWHDIDFTIELIPHPSPRPRGDFRTHHFYVKGAAENRTMIRHYIMRFIVYTRCEIYVEAYMPTPTGTFNNTEINLAEAGIIRPIGSCDVDNILKTYLDMIQGHLLLNDNLVTLARVEKFYSIKPRILIKLRYQDGFELPKFANRVKASQWYKKEFAHEGPPY